MNTPGWPWPRRSVLMVNPDITPENTSMQFRLTYSGRLMGTAGSNNRVDHKHEIRKVFHPQLKNFWELHPFLNSWKSNANFDGANRDRPSMQSDLASRFNRCGYNFVPLVTKEVGISCAIDILFLRHGWPGDLLHAGDIDNRLKTLFDALRMPSDTSELGKYQSPSDHEMPFFCLLEDDALISQISVTTDILLDFQKSPLDKHETKLVLTVSLAPRLVTIDNISFGGV